MRILFFIFLLNSFYLFSQQREVVDFIQVNAHITPNFSNKSVQGKASYTFKILKNTDSIYLDAHQMNVKAFESASEIKVSKDKIWIIDSFQKNQTYTINFDYEATPKQTFYFWSDGEFWTQGQGKYTSHWLPSLDDTNDKMIFNMSYKVPKELTVAANGKLIEKRNEGDYVVWNYQMSHPMSSYLVAVAGGNYEKETRIADSGIVSELYYKPSDKNKVEPTYRFSKEIFDFLEKEIGVAYPWDIYKQVPVRDFLYAGMENTSATIFSEAFLVDEIGFNDRNYVNVNAHELAHQWFGDMVTAKSDEHHWLQEGFATYYALLAEKEIFGDDYFYWQLLQYAEQLFEMSENGKGESLLNPKASSLTFYQKGAWALHALKEEVGEANFKQIVANYLRKYQFSVATTDDFLNEASSVYGGSLDDFKQKWLLQTTFPASLAYESLKKSKFIVAYFQVSELRDQPLQSKKHTFKRALEEGNEFIGQEVVSQLVGEAGAAPKELMLQALTSKNLFIRQAAAMALEDIPADFYDIVVKLLDDASYLTAEVVLYKLWFNFPKKQLELLNSMKNVIGFQNKNIRQLWLALAIATETYTDKEAALSELRSYTASEYSFEIREKAFEYIQQLNLWDGSTLKNLLQATKHPAWRFSKASKERLKEILKTSTVKNIIQKEQSSFSAEEIEMLKSFGVWE